MPLSAAASGLTLTAAGALAVLYLRNRRKKNGPANEVLLHIARSIDLYNPFPIGVIDRQGKIIHINQGASQLLGYNREELLGRSYIPLVEASLRRRAADGFGRSLQGATQQLQLRVLDKSGYATDVRLTTSPLLVENRIDGVLVTGYDVSEHKRVNERIRYMAYYDDMTGLPNRRLFMDQLKDTLERTVPLSQLLGVLYLDIDRFKLINDSFGREFGDMLLLQFAERLIRAVSEQDMVARMEGDEFAILLGQIDSPAKVMARAERLQEAIEEPFELRGIPFHVTISLGAAVSQRQERDAGWLIHKADLAMGKAKEQGRNNCLLYSEKWEDGALERLTLQHELRQALLRGDFVLHYQPQYRLSSGALVGLEALIRWRHPERGLLPPGLFIPLAEESGLIVQLGDWVMQEACRQTQAWQQADLPTVPISVNLSMGQFQRQNLIERVEEILNKTGLDPAYLELEITESMTMDVVHATAYLQRLKAIGVAIIIDDFGTGYSSFNYLKNLPISKLKIDRSFVRDLSQDPNDAAIVAAIIAMAHNLNLEVIAEGVETSAQLDFLSLHRCDEIQGFLYNPPLPAERIPELLETGRPS
ncbi:EAL domain-containing protein [Paenibacillus sp. IB182496]|uniref:EAL domain-containing protein n=2 Tax=Paenibacillus sabuli TaxID=2772509 RepID=A0A927GV01_9BACL|nr:EAL domain-containing protein [Paenibacillus sabuli]